MANSPDNMVKFQILIPKSLAEDIDKILKNPTNPAPFGFKERAFRRILQENLPRLKELLNHDV